MAERKATVLLAHHLKQLKLPTMLRDYASLAAVCGRPGECLLRDVPAAIV